MEKFTAKQVSAAIIELKLEFINATPKEITVRHADAKKLIPGIAADLPVIEISARAPKGGFKAPIEEGRRLATHFDAAIQITFQTGQIVSLTAGLPTALVLNQMRN